MQGSNAKIKWHVALRPGKCKGLDSGRELHKLLEKAERLQASVRSKVEHPFRMNKQQFGYAKVRYRGGKEHGSPDDAVCPGQSVGG